MISIAPITSKEGASPIAVVLPIIETYQQRKQLDSVIFYVSIFCIWMWVTVKTLLPAEREACQKCLALTAFRPHLDSVSINGHHTIVPNKIDDLGEFIALGTNLYLNHNSYEALFHYRKGHSNFRNYLRHLQHKIAPLIGLGPA